MIENNNEQWCCPNCNEREQLMRAKIKDKQTGKVRVKFQCAKCGYEDVQEFTEAPVKK